MGILNYNMRFTLAVIALTAVSAIKIDTEESYTADPLSYTVLNNKIFRSECPLPLEKSEEEMQLQLSQFSRTFDKTNYDNAMKIYGALSAPLSLRTPCTLSHARMKRA